MTFENPITVKITAPIVEDGGTITFDGISIETTTPENATSQINKIFNIVGKNVAPQGMKRIITQEAYEE